jgi:predicted component of type VI protein secretion system
MNEEKNERGAFAKLTGPRGTFYLKKTKVVIGRNEKLVGSHRFWHVSNAKKISKKHAKIFWDFHVAAFFIQNIGRNKIWVNKKEVLKGDTVGLMHRAAVKVYDFCFYFLLPEQP